MTCLAYHIEDAYKKVTGMSAKDNVDAYEQFTYNLMNNHEMPIEVVPKLLWVITSEDGEWLKSWRYYPDDYHCSEDEYTEGIDEYDAEEAQIDLNIISASVYNNFIGVIK